MIDWARVEELKDEIGEDGFVEVVGLFLDEADQVIGRLSPDMDGPTMESDCHFLKGAALNLGFRDLAEHCQIREKAAAAGKTDIDLGPVRDSYHASRDALLTGLNQAAA